MLRTAMSRVLLTQDFSDRSNFSAWIGIRSYRTGGERTGSADQQPGGTYLRSLFVAGAHSPSFATPRSTETKGCGPGLTRCWRGARRRSPPSSLPQDAGWPGLMRAKGERDTQTASRLRDKEDRAGQAGVM